MAETENQIIFRQNMFGNSYSTLNILPNCIQYVNSYSILIFFFFLFLSKNQTLSVELENDTKCFYLIWMFFLSFMKTHIEWAKTYLRISEITSPILEGPLIWIYNISITLQGLRDITDNESYIFKYAWECIIHVNNPWNNSNRFAQL